jgi:hypothetical protein
LTPHHGRFGGRFLELVLLLGLLLGSVAFLVALTVGATLIARALGIDGDSYLGPFGFLSGLYLLSYPWKAYLRFYRYDPETLRPVSNDDDHGEPPNG